jgi:monoamine oxidase
MDTESGVVVVGAGFSGLSAGRALRRAGLPVVVLEARDRVGGRVHSVRLSNGAVAELGAEWIMEGDAALRNLAAELGIDLSTAGIDYIRRDARGELAATLEEQEEALEAARDARERLTPDQVRGHTLGSFIDSLPISDRQRATLRARLQGTTSSELDRVTLRITEADRAFHAGSGTYFRAAKGNEGIAAAMAAELPDVRLGHRVRALEQDGGAVTVRTDAGDLRARAAIVTVPPSVVADLAFRPELPAEQKRAFVELPMGVASKLAAGTTEPPALRALQDVEIPYWCWAALGEDPGHARATVAAFAGSPSAQEKLRTASGRPEAWMERLRALNPDVSFSGEVVLKTWADDPFARGSYSSFDDRSWDRIPLLSRNVGRIAFAGEHTAAPHDYGTMNGAILSGLRAAEDVLLLLA